MFILGSRCHKMVKNVVESPYLLRDLPKLSPVYQTYGLEVFHSFCTKEYMYTLLLHANVCKVCSIFCDFLLNLIVTKNCCKSIYMYQFSFLKGFVLLLFIIMKTEHNNNRSQERVNYNGVFRTQRQRKDRCA